MEDGTAVNNEVDWWQNAGGLTKCTFAPWRVVGEESQFVWSMVHDLGSGDEWRGCEELDARQLVGPRIFPKGHGTGV